MVSNIVRENVRNTAKKRKKSRLFGFWKKRKKRKTRKLCYRQDDRAMRAI